MVFESFYSLITYYMIGDFVKREDAVAIFKEILNLSEDMGG